MKTKQLFVYAILFCFITPTSAQFSLGKILERSKKKAEKNVENRIEKRIDKGVNKTLDAVEDSLTQKKKEPSKPAATKATQAEKASGTLDLLGQMKEPETPKPTLTWAKYDFVPGTEIIFEDNLEGEQNGEFPSKWDLSGGVTENAFFDGANVIMFRKNNINGSDGIVPLLKNRTADYLPEEFTIEFDAYYANRFHTYRIYLMDPKNQRNLDATNNISKRFFLRFEQNSADGRGISKSFYPGITAGTRTSNPGWRHVSISFNKRALKAYIDDARVLNIPNLEANPLGVCIAFHNSADKTPGFIKNIRIAKGAVPLYDKLLTDGKFVTTGIKFDVNKATIKPESMGTINYVVKMMTDHPDLKFCVEGHTDSDGDNASNQKLSEARSKAVMNKMIELGIDAERLTSKGHGESKPMTDNDTSEGKAQNRRVEFVKQ